LNANKVASFLKELVSCPRNKLNMSL
jgi:hypothetical protein